MSYEEFRRRIDTARQILVGAVPSPAGQIDQITYALMYKFMNDIDDQSAALGGKRTYFASDYAKYNWHELMKPGLEAHDQLELYRQAIQGMSKNPGLPPLFREIYQNAFLPFNSPNVLRLFLEEINKFNHGDSDDIGDAYEYLLSITGAQGDVGQFRTPRHIIKFIVEAVNPTKDDTVLDPAVGTAGFLIAAYNHVKSQHDGVDERGKANDETRLNADELEKLHKNYRGFDIDPTMVRTASVNLYLHNFAKPDIRNHDSLSSEEYWNDRYDVILANPPFMSPKGGIQPHKKFSISANRAEVLFVDYIASHLKPNGRAGIVVPEGIIFQSGKAYKELRKNLVENYLYAVVSLPAGVFQPYSGVKTSVLLFDKVLAKEHDDILFVKVENDGYTLGAQRRRDVLRDQLPQALDVINLYKENYHQDTPFAHSVSREKIAESGDYNLSGDRYKAVDLHANHSWQIVELGEIVDVLDKMRKPITKSNRKPGEYPYYGATGILDFVENFIFEERLVLLGEDGAKWKPGEKSAFIAEGKYWVNNHAHVLKPKNNLVIDTYLVNVLNEMDLMPYITGVTVPKLNQEKMRSIKIPLPPIKIQREIVAELDSYQKIIDAAQTIVKTYKPTIKINSKWQETNLGKVADFSMGGTPPQSEINSSGASIPWVKGSDLAKGEIFETENHITQRGVESSRAAYYEAGTVLVGRTGQGKTRGTVAILRNKVTTNETMIGIFSDKSKLDCNFLRYLLMSRYSDLRGIAGDNLRGGITQRDLSNFKIPLPPIEIQQEIVAKLEAEKQLIDANKKLIEIYQQKIKTKIAEIWGQ